MTTKDIYINECPCDDEDGMCMAAEAIFAKKWTMHSAVYKSQDLLTTAGVNPNSSQGPEMCIGCTVTLEDSVINAEPSKFESRTPAGQHYRCKLSIKDNKELAKEVADYFSEHNVLVEVAKSD